ncbi:MAG: hypothetical protein HYU64_20335, partial [Armatimonadetes bacterium]|nr:hypothetical protein [Armatimonadota bacterium]
MSNLGGVDPNSASANDMIRNKNQVGAQNLETDKKTREESTSTPPQESYIPAPKSMEQVEIQVPMLVPKFFTEPGPDGKKVIDAFTPQQLAPGVMGYMPPGAIVTTAQEVQDFKKQVQEETLPPGMKPVLADSLDAKKVDVGMKLASRLLQTAGGFAAYSMTGGPMGMSIPIGIAAPLAAAGGILGVVDGVTQIKEGLNHKQYMQQLKASGVEETVFPIIMKQDASGKEIGKTLVNAPVMRKKGETIEYQAMNVPLDAVIA